MPIPPLKDPRQLLRFKRIMLALGGAAVHTAICWLLWEWNFFRATSQEFWLLFGSFWLVNLVFALLILTGLNKSFRDPSMTLALMVWATIAVMISVYFISQLRMVVLMFYPLVMVFGAFRLRLAGFLLISALAIAGYGAVIFFLRWNQVEPVDLRVEYIQWIGFSLVVISFSLVGADLSALRRSHRRQNRDLAEALDKINRLAITDELTGIWNRRQIMRVLRAQRALAERGGYDFSVCYLDIDHFKRVNDRYGHNAGDLVLQKVAASLREELREIDFFARFGGEEFIAVLANTPLPEAKAVAERLRRRVQGLRFGEVDKRLRVTISLGVAGYRPGEPVEELLRRADEALYQAKAGGRNRVVVADGRPPVKR